MNIAKILKKFWENKNKEIHNLANALIIKWKKISKNSSNTKSKTEELEDKNNLEISKEKIQLTNSLELNNPEVNFFSIYFQRKLFY